MKIIGITGSSGAGKTTISGILKHSYNAEVIDADKIAKNMARRGNRYLTDIMQHFGVNIVDEHGELKRKELASIVYENDKKREELNEITFKHVVNEIKDIVAKLGDKRLIVIDAPLLFESNLDEICDIVIGVIAKEEDKIKRICNRDRINEETAKKRIDIQKDNDYIKEKSDFIIYNESSIDKLKEQVESIIEEEKL